MIAAIIVILIVLTVAATKLLLKVGKYDIKAFEIKPSRYNEWDGVLTNPGKIEVEVLHAGDIQARLSGCFNLKNPKAKNLTAPKGNIPVLAILIKHKTFGCYLIDTGFDRSYRLRRGGNFEGLLKSVFFKNRYYLQVGQGIDEQLKDKGVVLSGVLLTHFHEHLSGAPALPGNIPYIFGKGEKEEDFYPLVFSRFLKDKTDLQMIDFTGAQDMPLTGKAADVFGDGSLWAISTPGHTKGHISYLVNGLEGVYLVTGDVSVTKKGFDLDIETGDYCKDVEANRRSFEKLKALYRAYPQIKPIFGHESSEYPIQW